MTIDISAYKWTAEFKAQATIQSINPKSISANQLQEYCVRAENMLVAGGVKIGDSHYFSFDVTEVASEPNWELAKVTASYDVQDPLSPEAASAMWKIVQHLSNRAEIIVAEQVQARRAKQTQ